MFGLFIVFGNDFSSASLFQNDGSMCGEIKLDIIFIIDAFCVVFDMRDAFPTAVSHIVARKREGIIGVGGNRHENVRIRVVRMEVESKEQTAAIICNSFVVLVNGAKVSKSLRKDRSFLQP